MGKPGETPAARRQRLKGIGWIGVDLDATLAEYHGWDSDKPIGDPIPAMVARVKAWLREGFSVRIFTARVAVGVRRTAADAHGQRVLIEGWCNQHVGEVLPITCEKDYEMIELWDDRAVQVVPNEGRRADGAWDPVP